MSADKSTKNTVLVLVLVPVFSSTVDQVLKEQFVISTVLLNSTPSITGYWSLEYFFLFCFKVYCIITAQIYSNVARLITTNYRSNTSTSITSTGQSTTTIIL
jgi:hypothetical protein